MLWLVILFPLLGAALNGLFLRKVPPTVSHVVGSAALVASFVCALIAYVDFITHGGEATTLMGFQWLVAGGFKAPFALLFGTEMLLKSNQGATWRRADYQDWLTKAGFEDVSFQPTSTPSSLVFAR